MTVASVANTTSLWLSTGHSGRNIREALLVWWFLPLVVLYVFTSLIFEGPHGFSKSMREFKNELLND
jgi:hypothetical protein